MIGCNAVEMLAKWVLFGKAYGDLWELGFPVVVARARIGLVFVDCWGSTACTERIGILVLPHSAVEGRVQAWSGEMWV